MSLVLWLDPSKSAAQRVNLSSFLAGSTVGGHFSVARQGHEGRSDPTGSRIEMSTAVGAAGVGIGRGVGL